MTLLYAAFVLLQVADGVTTYLGLSGPYGNVAEANPLARWAFQRFGLVAPIVALKAVMAALGAALVLTHHPVATWGLGLLTAVGAAVVVNNLKVLREAA